MRECWTEEINEENYFIKKWEVKLKFVSALDSLANIFKCKLTIFPSSPVTVQSIYSTELENRD